MPLLGTAFSPPPGPPPQVDTDAIVDGLDEPVGKPKPQGIIDQEYLAGLNYTDEQISDWRDRKSKELSANGKSPEEIDSYFGVPPPEDHTHIAEFAKIELDKMPVQENPLVLQGNQNPEMIDTSKYDLETFEKAFLAGFQLSTTGLATRGKLPDIDINEHSDMAFHLAKGIGTLVGDIPTLFVGEQVGEKLGAGIGMGASGGNPIAGGVGAVLGGGFGAFGLTEFYRKAMMDSYARGTSTNAKEWYKSVAPAVYAGVKGGAVGAATAGVGTAVPVLLKPFVASGLVKGSAKIAAEVTTMTTVGAALEGHLPSKRDFLEGAILVAGMHGVMATPKLSLKLMKIYEKTGVKPEQVAEMSAKDPVLLNEVLSENVEVPSVLQDKVTPSSPESTVISVDPSIREPIEIVKDQYKDAVFNKLPEIIEKNMPETATKQQVEAMARDVSPEEKKWFRLNQFLNNKEKIDKTELMNFLAENKMKLEVISLSGNETGYEKYKSDGGSNYKELLFTAPDVPGKFVGSHFPDENVLFHARTTDRVDVSGKKTLFIEELQSDWHGEARKSGYTDVNRELFKPYVDFLLEKDAKPLEIQSLTKEVLEQYGAPESLIKSFEEDVASLPDESPVKGAPLKKTWQDVAINKIVDIAEQEGYERVAFTNSKQQIERYPRATEEEAKKQKSGMEGFYDKIVPDYLRKKAKQLDVGTGKTQIEFGSTKESVPYIDVPDIFKESKVVSEAKIPISKRVEPSSPKAVQEHIRSMIKKDESRLPRSWQEFLDKIQTIKTEAPKALISAYVRTVNRNQAMKNAVKAIKTEDINPAEDPGLLIQLSGNWGRAKVALFNAVRDFNDLFKYEGPSLSDAMKGIKKNRLESFVEYLVAKHGIDREEAGITTGLLKEGSVTLEDLKKFVKENEAEFGANQKKVTEYWNDIQKYEMKAGVISKEQYDANVKKWPNYIPSDRYFEAGEHKEGSGSGAVGTKGKKKLGDSERKYRDPLEILVEHTFNRIKNAETNRYMVSLFKLAEKNPEVAKEYLTKSKASKAEIDTLIKESASEGDLPGGQSTEPIISGKKGEISIIGFRDGKPEIWNVHDADLAEMFRSHQYEKASKVIELAGKFSKFLKTGVVNNPMFPVINGLSDQIAASIYSPEGIKTVFNTMDALFSDVWSGRESKNMFDWLAHGGGESGATSQMTDFLKHDVLKLQKGGFFDSPINLMNPTAYVDIPKTGVGNPLNTLNPKRWVKSWETVNNIVESSTRVGLWNGALRRGEDPFKAALSSRQDTLDFSVRGSSDFMRGWNKITAYQNVGIQALDKLFIQGSAIDKAKVMARGASFIMLPSLVLWATQKDNPRYQRLDDWEKWGFWHILADDWQEVNSEQFDMMPYEDMKRDTGGKLEINFGVTYRFPKRELGLLFASLPIAMADKYFNNNPKAFKGFKEALLGQLPNYMPTVLTPELERRSNVRELTGAPLIPSALEDVSGNLQYTDYTTETAKIIGNVIGSITSNKPGSYSSPIVIENFIKDWGGWAGMASLKAMDAGLRAAGITQEKIKPDATMKDNPFVASFITRTPTISSQYVQDYYDRYGKTVQRLNDIKSLISRAEYDEAEKQQIEAEMDGTLIKLKETNEVMSDLRKMISGITRDPEITSEEKRRLIDLYYYQMMSVAEEGIRQYDEIDEEYKQNTLKGGDALMDDGASLDVKNATNA